MCQIISNKQPNEHKKLENYRKKRKENKTAHGQIKQEANTEDRYAVFAS